MLARLVVLVDDPVADVNPGEGIDAERADAELVADRAERAAAIAHGLDRLERDDRVLAHDSSVGRDLRRPIVDWRMDAPLDAELDRLAVLAEPVRRSLYLYVAAQRHDVSRSEAADASA